MYCLSPAASARTLVKRARQKNKVASTATEYCDILRRSDSTSPYVSKTAFRTARRVGKQLRKLFLSLPAAALAWQARQCKEDKCMMLACRFCEPTWQPMSSTVALQSQTPHNIQDGGSATNFAQILVQNMYTSSAIMLGGSPVS